MIQWNKETLEDAACTFIDLEVASSKKTSCRNNGSCTVNLQTLLEQGLIVDSDLVNPKTGTAVSTSNTVTISYNAEGIKSCSYNE